MTTSIYVENGVGKAVMQAINLFTPGHGVTAEWQHAIHPEMQRSQNGDEWWIRDIARRDMAILTQDRAILDVETERAAVVAHGAKLLALGNAHYTTWQKLRCVVSHWDAIDDVLQEPGPAALTLLLTSVKVETFP